MSGDENNLPGQTGSDGSNTPSSSGTPTAPGNDPPARPAPPRRRILIGSQRDPDAYKPKPKRDWVPATRRSKEKAKGPEPPPTSPPQREESLPSVSVSAGMGLGAEPSLAGLHTIVSGGEGLVVGASVSEVTLRETLAPEAPTEAAVAETVVSPPSAVPGEKAAVGLEPVATEAIPSCSVTGPSHSALAMPAAPSAPVKRFPPPNLRDRLPPDLEEQFQAALADVALDTLMVGAEAITAQPALEPDSRHKARVVSVGREHVFLELGGREPGVLPLRAFPEAPQPGSEWEVVVVRFNAEEGLYELMLPMAAAEIADWSQLREGMLVEARVTGYNEGGLECEVNHIRGFIPISQIALYRVENLAEFVDQRLRCLITEANPYRRNLVLSRRAVLEREREEARRAMFESLAPGQIREGVVRKLMDFGAFVDLGSGVDGLLHVSQLGWGRIKHPSDVLHEGQTIRVRIDKVDPATRRISLSYKDLLEDPWNGVDRKYLAQTVVRGKVVKLMDFGAFVELEPGVEGLVHISELSTRRVARVADVVREGQEVDVFILSVDPTARRISLSMKNAAPPTEPESQATSAPAQPPSSKPKPPKSPSRPLLGGLGRSPRGSRFGLKW